MGGGEPLGSTIVLFDDAFASHRTIVGVARDVRAESVDQPASPTVYLPFAQHPGREVQLVLRTAVPPEQLVRPVADRLRRVGDAVSITSVRPFDAVVGGALSGPRFTALLVGSFAALALTIAVIGVFGIVGFLVARGRTRSASAWRSAPARGACAGSCCGRVCDRCSSASWSAAWPP